MEEADEGVENEDDDYHYQLTTLSAIDDERFAAGFDVQNRRRLAQPKLYEHRNILGRLLMFIRTERRKEEENERRKEEQGGSNEV